MHERKPDVLTSNPPTRARGAIVSTQDNGRPLFDRAGRCALIPNACAVLDREQENDGSTQDSLRRETQSGGPNEGNTSTR